MSTRNYAVHAVVVATAVLWSLPSSFARADDHRAPEAFLQAAKQRQQGARYHSDWVAPSGGEICSVGSGGGPIRFRKPLHANEGPVRGRITLTKPHRPKSVDLVAWQKLDEDGQPEEPSEKIQVALRPKRRHSEVVAWVVRFTAALEEHLYLSLDGRWRDRDGCGGTQLVQWSFHIAVPT